MISGLQKQVPTQASRYLNHHFDRNYALWEGCWRLQ